LKQHQQKFQFIYSLLESCQNVEERNEVVMEAKQVEGRQGVCVARANHKDKL
jgi:hypothetical protein